MGERRAVAQTVTAQDQWTGWITGWQGDVASLSIAGSSFSGTVTLQRRLGDGNVRTVTTWTADAEKSYVFDEAGRVGAEASGEYKRAQALRMLLNQHPEARERDCALAIEVALCSV